MRSAVTLRAWTADGARAAIRLAGWRRSRAAAVSAPGRRPTMLNHRRAPLGAPPGHFLDSFGFLYVYLDLECR
eukprot:2934280-Lingulodinium_polyedra.AAC.1